MSYEYAVVPAPKKGLKAKGVKTTEDRFAYALQTIMNEYGAEGWEYVRTDTLPSEERSGLAKRTTVYQNMMVFRKASGTAVEAPAPAAAIHTPPTAPAPQPTPQVAPAPAPAPAPNVESRPLAADPLRAEPKLTAEGIGLSARSPMQVAGVTALAEGNRQSMKPSDDVWPQGGMDGAVPRDAGFTFKIRRF